ncbi:MAG: hypothetical protein NWE96_04180 [Candidatus Bathyarchaeota archaeon]|mgnify:CR=1 FL=1|nr:hypothetical protein [Candidatus Bathyarchaeota archaeon]
MRKLTLMKKFMQNFVGKGVHLVIKEKEGNFRVHTIEIMQKTDESCPVKDISVGDYFLHLVAVNRQGSEASIVCNWSDDLLKSLMANYKEVKDAECSQITMFRDPSGDENKWLLTWGNQDQTSSQPAKRQPQKKDPIRYIS